MTKNPVNDLLSFLAKTSIALAFLQLCMLTTALFCQHTPVAESVLPALQNYIQNPSFTESLSTGFFDSALALPLIAFIGSTLIGGVNILLSAWKKRAPIGKEDASVLDIMGNALCICLPQIGIILTTLYAGLLLLSEAHIGQILTSAANTAGTTLGLLLGLIIWPLLYQVLCRRLRRNFAPEGDE